MEKEYLINSTTSYSVKLVQGRADCLRKIVETTNTVRVYENGAIGVAGSVGKADFDALEKKAIENLSLKLPYPCKLPTNKKKSVDTSKPFFNPDKMVKFCDDLGQRINKEFPDFIFSGQFFYNESERSYKNTLGTELSYRGNTLIGSLAIKAKGSADLLDTGYDFENDKTDVDGVIKDLHFLLDNFNKKIDLEDGKYPVIVDYGTVFGSFIPNLLAQQYAAGTSLVKEKLNNKIFADNVSIYFDRNPETQLNTCFFDTEGEYADDYHQYFIKDGILKSLLGTKNDSQKFNIPTAQNSGAEYDDLPSLTSACATMPNNKVDIIKATAQKTLWLNLCSGGDMTTSGDFATPVQFAYMIQDGKILGKLPNFQISGNIFDLFGKDFVSSFENSFYKSGKHEINILTHANAAK